MLLVKRMALVVRDVMNPLQVVMETSGIGNRHVHIHTRPRELFCWDTVMASSGAMSRRLLPQTLTPTSERLPWTVTTTV